MSGIFRGIKAWLAGSPAPNVNTARLRTLKNTEEWDAYLQALDKELSFRADALLASQDAYHDTLLKGVCIGLRKAGTLVDEILKKEQQLATGPRTFAGAAGPTAGQRTTATFGSPAWRNQST